MVNSEWLLKCIFDLSHAFNYVLMGLLSKDNLRFTFLLGAFDCLILYFKLILALSVAWGLSAEVMIAKVEFVVC